jgi:hypothetical protein
MGQSKAEVKIILEKRIWNRGSIMEKMKLLQLLNDEFDSYDYDELLSDTNYDNSYLTNQDESEVA